jgi:hypothetical protein
MFFLSIISPFIVFYNNLFFIHPVVLNTTTYFLTQQDFVPNFPRKIKVGIRSRSIVRRYKSENGNSVPSLGKPLIFMFKSLVTLMKVLIVLAVVSTFYNPLFLLGSSVRFFSIIQLSTDIARVIGITCYLFINELLVEVRAACTDEVFISLSFIISTLPMSLFFLANQTLARIFYSCLITDKNRIPESWNKVLRKRTYPRLFAKLEQDRVQYFKTALCTFVFVLMIFVIFCSSYDLETPHAGYQLMNVENRKEFRSRFFSKKVIITGIVNTNFWFKFFNFTDAVLAYGKYRLLFDVEKNPGPSAYRENTTARDEAKSWTFVDGQKVYNVYSEQQLYDLDAKTNELQKLINDCNNGKGGKDDIDKYTGRKLLNYQKRCEMLNTPPIIIATTKTQNLYAPLLKSGKRTAVDVNVTPGGKMCTIFINEDQRVYTKPLDSVSVKTVFEVFSGTRYSTEVDYGRSAALYLLYLHKSNEYDPKMVIKNEMYDATQVALIIDGADKICDSQQPVKSINGIDVNDFIPTYGPPLMDEEEIDVKQKAAEVSLRAINAEKKTPSSELELEMRIQKEKRDIAKTGATQQRLTLEERANNKDRLLQANLTNTRNANRSADAPAPSTQVIANKDRNQGKSVHSLYNRVQAIYMSAKTPKVLINVLLNQALKNVLFVSTLAGLIVKYQTHVAAFSRDNALTGDLDNLNVILAWVAHFFVSKDTEKVNRENIAIFFVRLITTTTIYPTIHMDTKVCPICYVLNLLDLKESHGIFSSVVPGAPFEYEGPTDQTVLLNKNNANVTKAWALRHNQEMHALNGNIAYTTKFSGDNILKTTMRYFESADRQMFTQASQHRLQEIPYHPTDVLNNPVCLMQVQVNKQKAAAPVIRPVNMLMDTVLYSNTPAAQRGVLVGQRGLGRGVIAKDGLATVPYGSQIAYNVGQTYGTSSLSFEPTTTGMACEKLANAQVGDANQMDSVLSIAKQSNTQSTVSEQLSLASIMSTFCSPTSQSGTLNFIMKAVGYQAAKTPTPCRTSNIDG